MSEDTDKNTLPAVVIPPPAATGTTTREQQRKINADADAIEDGEKPAFDNKRKDKDKETFKGKLDKLEGNVFQLAEEGRKGNQFTLTLDAIKSYVTIEYEHAKDLEPLFECPSCEVSSKYQKTYRHYYQTKQGPPGTIVHTYLGSSNVNDMTYVPLPSKLISTSYLMQSFYNVAPLSRTGWKLHPDTRRQKPQVTVCGYLPLYGTCVTNLNTPNTDLPH